MKILFACGGTGGDIFPAVAAAEALREAQKEMEAVFVGTKRGLEKKIIGGKGWRLEMIETGTFADKKGLKKLGGLFPLGRGICGAFRLLKREKPSMVVGVGGYVAAPVFIAAFCLGVPSVAMEPNATPGLASRLIRHFASRVVTAYPEANRYFGKKGILLGVPIRKELLQPRRSPAGEKKNLFLFGGSLGAGSINDGIIAALPHLSDLKGKIHFIHQTGAKADWRQIEENYRRHGFSAEVHPFIEKMGEFYAKADLAIARSGAGTVAELSALKIPSLLIPYPRAREGHQEANARSLERIGGARVLLDSEVTGETLAKNIRALIENPAELATMRANLEKMKTDNAAEKVAAECLKYV